MRKIKKSKNYDFLKSGQNTRSVFGALFFHVDLCTLYGFNLTLTTLAPRPYRKDFQFSLLLDLFCELKVRLIFVGSEWAQLTLYIFQWYHAAMQIQCKNSMNIFLYLNQNNKYGRINNYFRRNFSLVNFRKKLWIWPGQILLLYTLLTNDLDMITSFGFLSPHRNIHLFINL